jgi:hypothetical protein
MKFTGNFIEILRQWAVEALVYRFWRQKLVIVPCFVHQYSKRYVMDIILH